MVGYICLQGRFACAPLRSSAENGSLTVSPVWEGALIRLQALPGSGHCTLSEGISSLSDSIQLHPRSSASVNAHVQLHLILLCQYRQALMSLSQYQASRTGR